MQNLIDRFRSGLSKTRSILVDGITAAVSGTAIDENVLEEIEGILIQADLGVGMATDIPVGISAALFGAIFVELSMKAIRSIPEDPSVLYDGN